MSYDLVFHSCNIETTVQNHSFGLVAVVIYGFLADSILLFTGRLLMLTIFKDVHMFENLYFLIGKYS